MASAKVACDTVWKRFRFMLLLQYGIRSLGSGVRKNGVRNRCLYWRCGVDTEIPYRLPFWREFCLFLPVRVAPGVGTEFPYRVRIVDSGVDCTDPVCRHRFRFLPCPSFPGFLERKARKTTKKQGFFIPAEPLKPVEKKGKTLGSKKQGIPRRGKRQGIQKKTRKGRTG